MALTQTFNTDASGNEQISGTVTANAGTGTFTIAGTVTANAGTGTMAVSAASLPLPSGAATSAKQPALGTAGAASADVLTVQGVASMTALKVDGSAVTQPVSIAGTVSTTSAVATTGTITSVAGSASSVSLLALNASRKGVTLYNDSTAICRVAFAATASATSFTILMQPNSYYENNTLYTGVISGIWASAAGSMRVTELT